jgi:exodeoxyribonuclease-3
MHQPTVLCLQETKVQDSDFPEDAFASEGYRSLYFGQKTYNGVSIHLKDDYEDPQYGFFEPGHDEQKRMISVRCGGIRVVNVYVPQGESPESEKFAYKIKFLSRLRAHLSALQSRDSSVVLVGDFNIAPDERDLYDSQAFKNQVMFHPEEHAVLEELKKAGFHDSLRLHSQEAGHYSWWDYRNGAFWKNRGWRLDHIWITAPLVERCTGVQIDKNERKKSKPSDHVPVTALFDE